jgi:hypothetical protein
MSWGIVQPMRVALIVLLALGCVGCVRAERPAAAVEVYADAVASGNYARAYDLMSAEYQRRVSREEFIKMLRESPADLREGARRLRAGAHALSVHASYVYEDTGEELRLVQEDGKWRFDVNPLDFYPQDTPRGALRSFIRAVELKRYDVLVRLVPKSYAMTEAQLRTQFEGPMAKEVAALLGRLRGALDAPVDLHGDQASILYGDRQEIRFRREDGVWKIEDFD